MPAFPIDDIQSMSMADSYQFISNSVATNGERSPLLKRSDVYTPIPCASAEDVWSMYTVLKKQTTADSLDDTSWLPTWISNSSPTVSKRESYSSFLRLWRQYLSCLSTDDDTTFYQRKHDVRSLENALVHNAALIDYSSIPEDVQNIQSALRHFDVFTMTENKKSQVCFLYGDEQ